MSTTDMPTNAVISWNQQFFAKQSTTEGHGGSLCPKQVQSCFLCSFATASLPKTEGCTCHWMDPTALTSSFKHHESLCSRIPNGWSDGKPSFGSVSKHGQNTCSLLHSKCNNEGSHTQLALQLSRHIMAQFQLTSTDKRNCHWKFWLLNSFRFVSI